MHIGTPFMENPIKVEDLWWLGVPLWPGKLPHPLGSLGIGTTWSRLGLDFEHLAHQRGSLGAESWLRDLAQRCWKPGSPLRHPQVLCLLISFLKMPDPFFKEETPIVRKSWMSTQQKPEWMVSCFTKSVMSWCPLHLGPLVVSCTVATYLFFYSAGGLRDGRSPVPSRTRFSHGCDFPSVTCETQFVDHNLITKYVEFPWNHIRSIKHPISEVQWF